MTDEYRRRLVAEAEILQLMPQKDLGLWTRDELRAVLTKIWVADYDLPSNTAFSPEQFHRIANHRFPGMLRAPRQPGE